MFAIGLVGFQNTNTSVGLQGLILFHTKSQLLIENGYPVRQGEL